MQYLVGWATVQLAHIHQITYLLCNYYERCVQSSAATKTVGCHILAKVCLLIVPLKPHKTHHSPTVALYSDLVMPSNNFNILLLPILQEKEWQECEDDPANKHAENPVC